MQHKDKIVLQKICSELNFAINFLESVSLEEFLENEVMKRVIGMTSINIGELVKNLDIEFRQQYPEVAWKDAAKFRDVVAHKYESLNFKDIYKTVIEDFPKMKKQVEKILETE